MARRTGAVGLPAGSVACRPLPKRLGQFFQLQRVDLAAGEFDRRALQRTADLTDFPDVGGGDASDDGPAIGGDVDDTDPFERDERFADRRGAHLKPLGQTTNDQSLPRLETSTEDVGQQTLDDDLAALTVVETGTVAGRLSVGRGDSGHGGRLPFCGGSGAHRLRFVWTGLSDRPGPFYWGDVVEGDSGVCVGARTVLSATHAGLYII